MLIEFKSKELSDFKEKIEKESVALIAKIIKENCPISVGEKVKVIYGDTAERFIVSEINLMAIDSWGWHGERLSFKYKGIPLKKNGKPMKNRKFVWFGSFEKNGKVYNTPSYLRVAIIPARMF